MLRGQPLGPTRSEVRAFLIILAAASGAVSISLLLTDDAGGLAEALRDAVFTVVSISSTTGCTTADFDLWGGFAESVILALMVVGGCAGSTAGGMKVIRVVLIGRSALQELRRQSEPRAVTVLRMGDQIFPEAVKSAVLGFFVIYVAVFALGVALVTGFGADEVTAISSVLATINVIGPGLGDVGASENFGAIADGGIVTLTALMLIGRLEIFTLLVLPIALYDRIKRR